MSIYEKINDKKYVIRIDGELRDINVPYGKAQILFESFVTSGGFFNSDGTVANDIVTMVTQFGRVGDILLSEYGAKGKVISEGDCSQLSISETIALFQLATEVVQDFTKAIDQRTSPKEEAVADVETGKAKKMKA